MLDRFEAYQLAKSYHWHCKRARVSAFLQEQLQRASASVSGRRTPDDQRRYYSIALGSLRERQAILEIERLDTEELRKLNAQLGAVIFGLVRKRSLSSSLSR